jgi:hypothetical protein
MGFDVKWIHLILMCVSSTTYSVIVNGTPMGRIVPSRGIRQGDLISPYLFLLCVEALSFILTRAESRGTLTGVPTSKKGLRINHLFFADDNILFCKANPHHGRKMSDLLQTYENASGQRLNKDKTYIFFSRNTSPEVKQTMLVLMGILETSRYDKYLGLPALVGKSRSQAFKSIKDQVWKRMQDWKLNFLSQTGKEVLLKAVVQAILTYSMCIFKLPKGLSLEINALMQKFWWGHQKNES